VESTECDGGGRRAKDSTETGVPDSGVGPSTPSSDDEAAASTPLPPSRAPLPTPAALLFAGDGPPVPVIEVTCGDRRAEFHLDRLADGLGPVSNSIGTSRTSLCVRTTDHGR